MRSIGKHIHRLHLPGLVPQLIQHRNIPGQGGGIAGDVDYALRLHVGEGLQHRLCAACPGWVYHYHIGPDALLVKSWHDLGGIAYYEFGVAYIVVPGILLSVLYGRLHDFYADDLSGFLGQKQSDGAGAAVGVNDGFLPLEVGIFQRLVVEDFRLSKIFQSAFQQSWKY